MKILLERREATDDLERYMQIFFEYNKNLECVIAEGRNEVLRHLEIPQQMWEDSMAYYIKNNHPKVMMLCTTFQANLK